MSPDREPVAEVRDNESAHRFEVLLDGSVAGFATYELRGGSVAILHTEVDPAFEGHGLGTTLIRGALDEIRRRGQSVLPYCPFTRSFLGRHEEYVDLVPEEQRARFGLAG